MPCKLRIALHQLEALLEAVITGQLPNERKALLAAVKIELDP